MEQILYRYNPWWENELDSGDLISRDSILSRLKSQLITKDIVFLTGLRRIGKTSSLKLLIKYLIEEKEIEPRRIFYISLDDYLLSKKSIVEIVEEYRKVHKLSFSAKSYLFLDEIAYQNNFEQQLKNFYDSHNTKIFASSSQSSILKSKKALITGRSKVIEVLPLDFKEYLLFKGIKIGKKDQHLLEKYFEEFLQAGGIPEYVLRNDIEYIKELVDDIILKDISALHNIKDTQLLKDLFLLLMERCGKVFSINKLANILKVSPDTVRRHLEHFGDTYLVHLLPRYGTTNERILSAKKIYSCDLGIRTIFTGFREKGSLFENYIYLLLKNSFPSYVYKDGIEIDFITRDKILIEAKYLSGLTGKQLELFKNFNAKEKYLITSIYDIMKNFP
ncbi:MAG: ATP-binding protein [Bacteroidota bacterium]